uniref:Aminotransferase class I/classII large domain-containing protein n=1 Tax=Manihot esculenta TaxID=3983 RepID=A0A2C9USX8_MANES
MVKGLLQSISRDLPYHLSADDIYLTVGCTQAIEVVVSVLARPGANILLPRPGYPTYEAFSRFSKLEVRHFDLIPEKGWEVDIESVEAIADENTVAMVIINPGNPFGNVFTYHHLKKAAIPEILERTKEEFFLKIINITSEAADICYERIKEIPCISCPHKPDGSMFIME